MNTNVNSHEWHLIDASKETLGRAATKIAKLLQGKHKVGFVKNADTGDYVVVVNSEKITVTGNKETDKYYDRYSGYPKGGRKVTQMKLLRQRRPTQILQEAVSGMLPKNK